jgi:hypothetical protein
MVDSRSVCWNDAGRERIPPGGPEYIQTIRTAFSCTNNLLTTEPACRADPRFERAQGSCEQMLISPTSIHDFRPDMFPPSMPMPASSPMLPKKTCLRSHGLPILIHPRRRINACCLPSLPWTTTRASHEFYHRPSKQASRAKAA